MSVTDPFIGNQLGDYKIVDILGRGGMARVYRGFDPRLKRYAAVKVIDAALLSGGEEEYRARFLREAQAIAVLDHPYIVSVYQFGEFDSLYYMAMKFIEGRDLGQILKETGGALLTNAQILRIVNDITSALDYAHAAGVIHRDIKPSNIMVMKDGHAVLTDFGLALSVPEGSMGTTFGSAHYIAPEQALSSAQAVPQSDLYSLGVVIYQLLTGRVPFDDPSAMTVALKHLSDPPPPPRTYNPNVSQAVERVVLKALEKDIKDRFPTGGALARALESALGLNPSNDVYLPPLPFSATEFKTNDTGPGTILFPPDEVSSAASASSAQLKRRVAEAWTAGSEPNRPGGKFSTGSTAGIGTPAKLSSSEWAKARTTATLIDPPAGMRRRSRRPLALILGGVLAALVVIGGILLINGGGGGGDGTATLSAAAIATGSTETATATPSPTGDSATRRPTRVTAISDVTDDGVTAGGEGTATGTVSPTVRPPIVRTATFTPTRTPPVTRTPVTPTLTPSRTPSPTRTPFTPITGAGETAVVQLIYTEDTFILRNASARPVDISGWVFSQETAVGARTFESNSWQGGSRSVFSLPGNDCFQLWDILTTDQLPIPDICGARHAWRAIAPQRQFWVAMSGAPATATFEVRTRAGDRLAQCRIAAGECEIELDR